jgi:hypothetical protein
MVGHPLQRGIGKDHIERARFAPACDIAKIEAHVRQALARGLEHVLRTIHAHDRGTREFPLQELGRVAGATADIRRAPDLLIEHLRKQIANRPVPFVFELAVLGG